jgi:SAM-dependent methyltransferase
MERRVRRLRDDEIESIWSDEEISDLKSFCRGGGRAIHLQCAAGLETLFLLSAGADDVIGIDISEDMIDQARELAEAMRAPARFHCCDVLSAPSELDGTAGLVYTGGGALPWIMDISLWADVVARLLHPGGVLYLREGHPIDFLWDREAEDYHLTAGPSYCSGGIIENCGYPSGLIAMNTDPTGRPVMRERLWPLGDVINSLIGVGLDIRHFSEGNDPGWPAFPNMAKGKLHRLPHTYTLHAEKPA